MNQIKYLVNAVLLLLLLTLGVTLITIFFSNPGHESKPIVVNISSASSTTSFSSQGKKIFSENCQTCHALDKTLTGPALRGVDQRGPWIERKNLIKWVQNPAVTMHQFTYTKELVAQYGQLMPSFTNLTEKEIELVLDYITKSPMPDPIPSLVVD